MGNVSRICLSVCLSVSAYLCLALWAYPAISIFLSFCVCYFLLSTEALSAWPKAASLALRINNSACTNNKCHSFELTKSKFPGKVFDPALLFG